MCKSTPVITGLFSVVCLMFLATGCSEKSVSGGTMGVVQSSSRPVEDVRVVIYAASDAESTPIGFGVSDCQGNFCLYQNDAQGPLWLEPGQYCATIESIGVETRLWPKEYSHPQKTPLKITLPSSQDQLALEIPQARTPRF